MVTTSTGKDNSDTGTKSDSSGGKTGSGVLPIETGGNSNPPSIHIPDGQSGSEGTRPLVQTGALEVSEEGEEEKG